MVHVEALREMRNSSTGEEFIVLDLISEPVIKVSKATGNPYLTVMKASIFCTFTKEVAEKLLGTKLPGKIEKREVDEYQLTDPSTGEIKTLNHRNVFVPEVSIEEAVFS